MELLEQLDMAATRVDEHLHIRLICMAFTRIGTQWHYRDVISPFWRLYVNSCDGASLKVGNTAHRLTGGCVHLVPPWLRFDCLCDRPIEHFFIHFELVGLPRSEVRRLIDRPRELAMEPWVEPLVRELSAACAAGRHREPAKLLKAKALVNQSLAGLFVERPTPLLLRGPHNAAIEPALRLLEQRPGRRVPNADLARACGCSEHHFIRRFRDAMGVSPARYALERRIARAAELLIFTNHSIEQIADACGFASRFHFSRAFVRVIGRPPAGYRKRSSA
jgi:AraC-like DNA-binding protein